MEKNIDGSFSAYGNEQGIWGPQLLFLALSHAIYGRQLARHIALPDVCVCEIVTGWRESHSWFGHRKMVNLLRIIIKQPAYSLTACSA